MTRSGFEGHLKKLGFSKETTTLRKLRWRRIGDGASQYCALDNVRGSAWRLFLAVGCPPDFWPVRGDGSSTDWLEAESPWFQYANGLTAEDILEFGHIDNKEEALAACAKWLESTGLLWLKEPTSKTPVAWREEHNMLIRKRGGPILG